MRNCQMICETAIILFNFSKKFNYGLVNLMSSLSYLPIIISLNILSKKKEIKAKPKK